MEITTRSEQEVTVVDISGSLDTQTSGPASEQLTDIANNASSMLLNLAHLEFLSSAGLRVLLRTAKQLSKADGVIKVCGATGTVKEVLEISGFHNFLDLFDTEDQALAAF